jgi:hypothetical protein
MNYMPKIGNRIVQLQAGPGLVVANLNGFVNGQGEKAV